MNSLHSSNWELSMQNYRSLQHLSMISNLVIFLVPQDIRTEQKLWSGKAECPLRDCCYLPNNVASIDCLVAAGSDGSLYTCSHQENKGNLL